MFHKKKWVAYLKHDQQGLSWAVCLGRFACLIMFFWVAYLKNNQRGLLWTVCLGRAGPVRAKTCENVKRPAAAHPLKI